MPDLTQEQNAQLEQDAHYMKQAGMSDDDIERYLGEQTSQMGASQEPGVIEPSGRKAWKQFVRTAGPVLGGVAGSGIASRMGQLAQTGAEVLGIGAGDVGARAATGAPQNLSESGRLGLGGAGIGLVARGSTRLLGRMGGIPRFATEEAGVPTAGLPSYQKVGLLPYSSPGPRNVGQMAAGASAEESLADRARAAVGRLISKFTPERARKTAMLAKAGAEGAKVDLNPIMDKLIDQEIPNAVTDAAKAHNAAIERTFESLRGVYNKSGGTLSPAEADEMIRRQLNPKAYTASGDPATSSLGTAIREVQQVATEQLNKALPSEVRGLNKTISEKLDMMDEAERLFGGDRAGVVNRLRNLYQPGNEDNVRVLNFLTEQSGDKSLLDRVLPRSLSERARTAATKRAFTEDIRVPSETRGRPLRTLVETGAKTGTRMVAPLQPYVGPVAAGAYPQQVGALPDRALSLIRLLRGMVGPQQQETGQ